VRAAILGLDETVPTRLIEVLDDPERCSGLREPVDVSSLRSFSVARATGVVLDIDLLTDDGRRVGSIVAPHEGAYVKKDLLSRLVNSESE
jgi:hypothetical protein